MKKEYRIKKYSEIDAIISKKKTFGDDSFVIYLDYSTEIHFRYAISIGRKYGNAVERNLMKRRLRMIISNNKEHISSKLFIIVVKPKSKILGFQEIEKKVIDLLKKSQLIGEKK